MIVCNFCYKPIRWYQWRWYIPLYFGGVPREFHAECALKFLESKIKKQDLP